MECANIINFIFVISAALLLLNGMVYTQRLFLNSGFSEFLFLFMVFFLSLLGILVLLLPWSEDIKIKLFYSISSITYLPFLFFGNKIRKFPSSLTNGGMVYGLSLAISTIYWKAINEDLSPLFPTPFFNGNNFMGHYGLTIGKTILISSRFNAPLTIFRLFISLLLLYTMWSVEEDVSLPSLKKAKKIWVATLLVTALHDFLFLFGLSIITLFLLNLSLLLANYIMVFMPEGIILTKVQLFEIHAKVMETLNQVEKKKTQSSMHDLHKHVLNVMKVLENDP